jgi:hypothetical protein
VAGKFIKAGDSGGVAACKTVIPGAGSKSLRAAIIDPRPRA